MQDNIRKERIFNLLADIERVAKSGQSCDKEKVIAALMMDYGVARRTALEYLKPLICSGRVEEYKGGLIFKYSK